MLKLYPSCFISSLFGHHQQFAERERGVKLLRGEKMNWIKNEGRQKRMARTQEHEQICACLNQGGNIKRAGLESVHVHTLRMVG